ncbi:hypothetical protein HNP36_001285 [Chryseobacterium shigense]|uniref:Uncharacterized protein n=1 Tax=Chryseobacterium shigense TaxID=297244 RepID=A0A841NDX4_9FLAO|nr:hypothetical protein [Chryseobacterium shigense]
MYLYFPFPDDQYLANATAQGTTTRFQTAVIGML